jgi:hypothetical protein
VCVCGGVWRDGVGGRGRGALRVPVGSRPTPVAPPASLAGPARRRRRGRSGGGPARAAGARLEVWHGDRRGDGQPDAGKARDRQQRVPGVQAGRPALQRGGGEPAEHRGLRAARSAGRGAAGGGWALDGSLRERARAAHARARARASRGDRGAARGRGPEAPPSAAAAATASARGRGARGRARGGLACSISSTSIMTGRGGRDVGYH